MPIKGNLSIRWNIEHKFFTDFNNYYDQFDNMLINKYPSQNNQYVWSNKQHILMTNIIINPNDIEFIKRVNTIEDAQIDFITFVYDHINNDDIIQRISFSFHHDQQHLNQSSHSKHETVIDNDQLIHTLNPLKSKTLKSEVINKFVLDNDDQQHDICHHNTKICSYKSSNSNQCELWYVYCDTRYIDNDEVMEINIKRWNMSDYSLTWQTIQHCHHDITVCINSPNLCFLQS